jgi:hypothetical protein
MQRQETLTPALEISGLVNQMGHLLAGFFTADAHTIVKNTPLHDCDGVQL